MNKILKITSLLILLLSFSVQANCAETAESIMKKAASAVTNANGLSASFSLASGNQIITGTLISSGSKFALKSSTISTWYDGKTMWTLNSKSNETTMTYPTTSELAEANPLLIVNSYSNNFTAAFAKSQTAGSRTIILTPKSKKLGYKSVHVTIPNGGSFPTQIVVIPTSGQRIKISISKVKTGQKFTASSFVYPHQKYPNTEVVDLR